MTSSQATCEFSGLGIAECQGSICDCFRDIDPDNPGSLHPEVFTVATEVRPRPGDAP